MDYDKLLVDIFFVDDWHFNKSNLEKYKSHYKKKDKYLNIINYIESRYDDSESFKEILYRMKYKIDERPTCKKCGNKVKFIGKSKMLFRSFCCNKCAANDKETIKKKWESDSKNHNGKIGWIESNKSEKKKNNRKKTLIEKYGSEENANKYIYSKIKESFINKYGTDNIMSLDKIKKKHNKSLTKNQTYNKSKLEDACYDLLKEKYPDVIRQYSSELYPFNCDFYIPSIDTYIEIQGSQFHHFHPFNPNDMNDLNELERLKQLSDGTNQYSRMIYVWTDLDPRKRNTAKENNLNWIEFFNIKTFKEWLNGL